MIYLDWAASAPPEPEALEAVREAASVSFANPSSPHAAGRQAHELLEAARSLMASLLGGGEIVFTSGATESNGALLLAQLSRQRKADVRGRKVKIVTTALEHPSVYEQGRILEGMGLAFTVVAPGPDGIVDPGRLAESLDADTALVSVMLVSNETGAIQPVAGIADAVRLFSSRAGRRILVHTDAAQGFCKIPLLPEDLGLDAVSLSGHKIGGPRGIGALWLRSGTMVEFLSAGGGQEGGRRPGTENLPGISGMAAAARKRAAAMEADGAAARERTALFLAGLAELPGSRTFPAGRDAGSPFFSPYIVSFGFPPLPGEVVVRLADSRGLAIATGSACSSRKKSRTRVLESMGVPPEVARSAVRVSFGPSTTDEEIAALLSFLKTDIVPMMALSARGGR